MKVVFTIFLVSAGFVAGFFVASRTLIPHQVYMCTDKSSEPFECSYHLFLQQMFPD